MAEWRDWHLPNWIGTTDNQVAETYTYGGVGGRVSQRTTSVEGQSVTQTFAWNELGQAASVTYPWISGVGSQRTVSYTYSDGFLTAVPGFASSITYSVNAMPSVITHANTVQVTAGLDPNHEQRVASITTVGASASNLSLGPYYYDGASNVKSIGVGSTLQTFVYDQVSRLTGATIRANGVAKQQNTVFDAFGNVTQTLTTDWGTQNFSLNSSTNHLSSPVTYDGAGNMTFWSGFTYTYDKLGRLQTVTGTGVNHTYLYTANGERISDRDALAVPPTTTLTVRDLSAKVLRIYTKTGSTWAWSKDYVYRNGALLAAVDASATRHFHLDHLGTPRLITNGSHTTVATHDYYPFGLEAYGTADGERMKFTGQERDANTHDYMHARYYNPKVLRFLSPDLLRGDRHRPQTFNLFAYVGGNAVNYVDPFGLGSESDSDPGAPVWVNCVTHPLDCMLYLRSRFYTPDLGQGGSGSSQLGPNAGQGEPCVAPGASSRLAGWLQDHPFNVAVGLGGFAGLGGGAAAEVGAYMNPGDQDLGGYLQGGAGPSGGYSGALTFTYMPGHSTALDAALGGHSNMDEFSFGSWGITLYSQEEDLLPRGGAISLGAGAGVILAGPGHFLVDSDPYGAYVAGHYGIQDVSRSLDQAVSEAFRFGAMSYNPCP